MLAYRGLKSPRKADVFITVKPAELVCCTFSWHISTFSQSTLYPLIYRISLSLIPFWGGEIVTVGTSLS